MTKNLMNDRLCLKNVPISMTNDQIHSILLSDIEDVKIHIPKKNGPSNSKFKLVFVQFNSANEAKLCMKLINRLGYQNVEACYSDRQVRSNSEDPKEAIDSRSCEYCGRIASEYVCGNCHTSYSSAYYCSKDHQERDWQQHKQDCKRIPELKRIDGQDTVTETVALTKDSDRFNSESTEVPVNPQDFSKRGKYYIKTSDFGMAQGSIVNISAVINSRILYVHPVSKEYKELMRFLQHHVSSAPFLSEKPAINEYVLAPFLGTYHRARILECGPDTMKVHLTDIGQELSCNWQEFKHLNYKVRGKPSYTHKVILNDVKNLEMTDLVKNYLNGLCSQKMDLEIVEIFAVHTTEKKVVLKDVNTSAIINTTINYIYSGTSKSFYDTAKVPRFSTETPVKVFIADCSQLDDQSLLSCIPNDQFPEYFHLIDELKKYMNKLPSEIYVPTETDEICLVKQQTQWHRASFLGISSENQLAFVLIDRMVTVEVPKSDVRKCPQQFSQSFYTSLCVFEGLNEDVKNKLRSFKFAYVNVKYDDNCPVLSNLIV